MSVLIKGMEMPKEEEEAKILIIRYDGKVVAPFEATQEQAGAIEVQDHGRLIIKDGEIIEDN